MRILVVDDELKLAISLKRGLEEWGLQTWVTLDSKDAQRTVEYGEVQLVILDINLPNINSFSLCRDLKATNPQIPIIMLSSVDSLESKLSGFDAGADDYLVKPYEFRELLARIQVKGKRSQLNYNSGTINQLILSDLVVDLLRRTVKRAGQLITISPREQILLEYFLRNQGIVLTRREIVEKVWKTPYHEKSNLVDVCICTLRNKIDKGFSKKLIHTRVGIGYFMKES